MSFDAFLQLAVGALIGGGVTYLYMRHIAGWVTSFEAAIKADIAHLQGAQKVVTAALPAVAGGQAAVAAAQPVVAP